MPAPAIRHLFTWIGVVLLTASAASAQKRPITERDLFRFVWVADPQISPDGSRVAFVRVSIDEKADRYETSIWVARTDGREGPRRLTSNTRDVAPRWSPDGKRLAFVRSTEKDGQPQPSQIYILSLDGGEAFAITDIPKGANDPQWSPNGRTIAFSATALPGDLQKKKDGERESDVKVITEAVYRANGIAGTGQIDRERPSRIWIVPVPEGPSSLAPPRQITTDEFAASNVRWSADGSRIYFVANRRKEPYYYPEDSDVWSVSASGGQPALVASIEGQIGPYAFDPEARRLAFVGTLHGNPERSYSETDLFVVDLQGGTPRNLTASYEFEVSGAITGDQRSPRGASPAGVAWTRDGRTLVVRTGEQGDSNLKRVDVATGKMDAITTGHREVMSWTADAAGQRIATVVSTPTVVGDLYAIDTASGASTKLTSFNDELFGQLTLSEPEEIWYASFDGRKIQGWLLKPPSFDRSGKYPLILEIHGGPHSAYGNTFVHEFQWMAAKGYVVLFTNPRGSSNYGQEFGNSIQFKYPGDDHKDLMAGVDEVLKRGYIDANRLGVTGGSGGGLLTNWVVTQTTRFKAAVSQRDISDWANLWYTTDFTLFTPVWFQRAPFEDPADFARRSPITYVEKIQTPLMFILGDEDWRTPPAAGGEQLFRALKYLKRPTVMVRFPGENHELSRSGRPWHRVERLQHIVGWFDKWLLGKETSTNE